MAESNEELTMPAYCPSCGRPLVPVDKGAEIIPTCDNCNKRYYEASLGWVKKLVSKAEAKEVVTETTSKE